MVRRPLRTLLAVLAGAVGVAGCGTFEDSGYQFVRNRPTGTYLKVPEDWTVHGHGEVSSFLDRIGKTPVDFAETYPFVTTFGADDDLIAYPFEPFGSRPAGMVRVKALDPQERDELSFATMRDELVPVLQGVQVGQVELLSRAELRSGAARGERLRYVVIDPETSEQVGIDQTTLIDDRTQRLYLLVVGCEAACFERNERQIDEVVESLTIKER